MGYKYKNYCYETQADALQSYVDNCGVSFFGSGGSTNTGVAWCKANGTNVQYYYAQPGSANSAAFTYQYPITFPSCTVDSNTTNFANADVQAMAWLVVSVWVIAWGFKKMIEVLRK